MAITAGSDILASDFVSTSAGSSDSGRVPKLNSTGNIDRSFIGEALGNGTGADGALAISSGTTTIDLGGADLVIKNYTSISITGTGALAFTNPSANGTCIIFRVQGAVTITSSSSVAIDLRSIGSAAGVLGAGGGVSTNGAAGTDGTVTVFRYSFLLSAGPTAALKGGAGTGNNPSAVAGAGGSFTMLSVPMSTHQLQRWIIKEIFAGGTAGGGGGGSGGRGGTVASSVGGGGGSGGRGAGTLIIQAGGAYTFTTGTIRADGANGGNATATVNSGGGGGGGGGGAGGIFIVFAQKITTSGTVNVAGGTGGNGTAAVSAGTGNNGGGGGGGGGSNFLYTGGSGGVGGTDGTIGASNPGTAGGGSGGAGGSAGGGGAGTFGAGNTFGSGGGGGGGASGAYLTVVY